MSVQPLAELEKEAILNAIMECNGVLPAAVALGISRSNMYYKMRRYGIKILANEILRELRRQKTLPLSPKNGHSSSAG